jgi:hypothetical protein
MSMGQVCRTLRDLERPARSIGMVDGRLRTGASYYELTAARPLDEWAAVTKERARLIGEFDARYLETISSRRGP